MNVQSKLDNMLLRVEKPGRYIGGELHSVNKGADFPGLRFAFCFPDTYEIGMSYMGMQIIYHLLNKEENIFCERSFAPAKDMAAEMRAAGIPLYTLESKTPLREMDMVGFTLQYELSYTNILYMLDLAGIPFNFADRSESDPIIVGGGPCVFNAEPLADFFDLFIIGDGETAQIEVAKLAAKRKAEGLSKDWFLKEACKLQGVYVPSFYKANYGNDGRFTGMTKLYDGAPDRVLKAIVEDLEPVDFPERTIVPLIEAVQDRSVCELFRGCTRGCRFCQAGMVYRPVRERSAEKVYKICKEQLESSGNEELSLMSLSSSDYSQFQRLMGMLIPYSREKTISISLPSLRMDNFAFSILDELQGVRKTGLTFAAEAGTQRLRNVINKNITEDDIFKALDTAIDLGWNSVKLYFMMGLPTETDEDLDGIVDLAKRIMDLAIYKNGGTRGRFGVTVSVSNFVPKPDTPFGWVPQDTFEEFERKHIYLRDKLKKVKGVTYRYHGSFTSHLEAIFARGGRDLCETLRQAYANGCCFDSWTEGFNREGWDKALAATGVDKSYYGVTGFAEDEPLPWDVIDCGVSKEFLLREWHHALNAETTPDCRLGCNACGLNEHTICKMEGCLK